MTPPKRQTILDGMLEAVGAEGYERTSVRTVLDRTGVYRQAFYDNFADKDDCYLQAYDAGVERVEALLAEAAAGEESWQGQLRAGLGALLDFLDAEPDVGRALIVEVHAAGPEALAKRTAAMSGSTPSSTGPATRPGMPESPPPIAGEGIAAGIHAVIHSRLATGAADGFRAAAPRVHVLRRAALLRRRGRERRDAGRQGLKRIGWTGRRDCPTLIEMDSPSASNPESGSAASQALPRAYAVRSERERLLEAMVRVAAVKGYEETTVDDVIEAAGVTRETFDEMFAGKQACFLEAYDAVIDVLVAHVSTAFESTAGQPWPDRIAAGLRALVELLASEADIARMAMVEVTAVGEDARIRYRAALGRFTYFLEEGRNVSARATSCRPIPPASRSAAPPR